MFTCTIRNLPTYQKAKFCDLYSGLVPYRALLPPLHHCDSNSSTKELQSQFQQYRVFARIIHEIKNDLTFITAIFQPSILEKYAHPILSSLSLSIYIIIHPPPSILHTTTTTTPPSAQLQTRNAPPQRRHRHHTGRQPRQPGSLRLGPSPMRAGNFIVSSAWGG